MHEVISYLNELIKSNYTNYCDGKCSDVCNMAVTNDKKDSSCIKE